MSASLHRRWVDLENVLRDCRRVVVAFSGGCDSSFLLAAACRVLGTDAVVGATAISASLPSQERRETAALARVLGVSHRWVYTQEFQNPSYTSNPSNRCYFCKDELFSLLSPMAVAEDRLVVDGYNASDRSDDRPGLRAARERGIRHPLDEANVTKPEIRAFSRWMKLSTWNKPASPCLSSRIPYGTPVVPEVLERVDRAENVLRQKGFREVRVRHYENEARIEVPLRDLPRLQHLSEWMEISTQIRELGYHQVSVDPRGFRSGRLNDEIQERSGEKVLNPTKKI